MLLEALKSVTERLGGGTSTVRVLLQCVTEWNTYSSSLSNTVACSLCHPQRGSVNKYNLKIALGLLIPSQMYPYSKSRQLSNISILLEWRRFIAINSTKFQSRLYQLYHAYM